jgi:AcrR family transcriptional regulator
MSPRPTQNGHAGRGPRGKSPAPTRAPSAPAANGPHRPAASSPPAPAGKREQNKAHNREAILSAAREVFTELGYDGATVRDVIRRTRLASGTFYNYFPDKESVFRALMVESEARRLEWLRRVDRREGGYEEYLRRSFRAYFEFVASDRTTFDLLRRNAHTVRAMAKHDVLADEQARIRRLIASGIAVGALPEADATYVAAAIVGVAFEVAVIMVERDPVDVEAATDFVSDVFVGFFSRGRQQRAHSQGASGDPEGHRPGAHPRSKRKKHVFVRAH